MDSQNIFDLFGRQKKHPINIKEDYINSKLNIFFNNFSKSFKNHVKKTEHLVNVIGLSKNYISINGKRIVNVKPSINEYDVVIKSELDEVLDSIIKIGNDHSETKKYLNKITDSLINLGKYVENLEEKLEKELKFLFDGVYKSIKELNAEIILIKEDIDKLQ